MCYYFYYISLCGHFQHLFVVVVSFEGTAICLAGSLYINSELSWCVTNGNSMADDNL